MSTFNGIISELEGVSVDCFLIQNMKSRAFFLSHCHTDHYKGINSRAFMSLLEKRKYYVYTSEISRIILSNLFPELKDYVRCLTVGDSHTITVPKNDHYEEAIFNVKLIPAGHCPGSVMFLFSLCDGTQILYTGDFRLNGDDVSKIKYFRHNSEPLKIDKMYLDTTFWNKKYSYFPSREESCKAICSIIEEWLMKHPENKVNLHIPANIGTEYLYVDIYNKLKLSICVKARHNFLIPSYRQIGELENVFTSSSNARISASLDIDPNPRVCNIRVSAAKWWNYEQGDAPYKQENDRHYSVCYSSHSSCDELKKFLQYLKPKALHPCVVSRNINISTLNDFCKTFTFDSDSMETEHKKEPQMIKQVSCTFYSSESD